jgi:hypothetical protein
VVRPGSVIGPQQNFLQDMQGRMWAAGDALRARQAAAAPAFGKPATKAFGQWGADAQPATPTGAGDRIGAFYPETPAAPGRPQRGAALDVASLSSRLGGLNLSAAAQPGSPYRTSSGGGSSSSGGGGGGSGGGGRSASRGRSGGGSSAAGAPPAPATPTAAARGGAGTSILLQGRPGTTPARPAGAAPAAARSSSADRSRDRGAGAGGVSSSSSSSSSYAALGGLRTTLHTETTALASRPRTLPERVSQSAHFLSGLMQLQQGGGLQQAQDAAAAKSGVARVLAPNGQPRKVSAALLSAAGGLNSAAALSALVDMEGAAPGGGSARGRTGSNAWGGR